MKSLTKKQQTEMAALASKFALARDEYQQFLQAQIDDSESHYEDKSDAWKEGEKGTEFNERLETWKEAAQELADAGQGAADLEPSW